jgi:hypothetical protein
MDVITAINLKAPSPSVVWMKSLRASLAGFAPTGSPLTTGLMDENWPGPQAAHPIYSVGLRHILLPEALDSLDKIFCWRFIAGDLTAGMAAGCWATAEVDGVPARVIAAIRGAEAADVLSSANALNNLNIVSGQPDNHYDVRVLRVPGLSLEAFWLKFTGDTASGGASSDWIVPYGLVVGGASTIKLPGGHTLNKNQAYSVPEFLTIAGEAAQKRLAADHNPAMIRRVGI